MDKEIKVLDKGFVELIQCLGNDNTIVQSARVSTGQSLKTVEEDKKLIGYLLKNKHWSPFEHVVFQFRVKLPIFVARQWMRHRDSYNEISGRYTEFNEREYYVPEKWRLQSKLNKQGSNDKYLLPDDDLYESYPENYISIDSAYWQTVDECFDIYEKMIEKGIAKEMARMILPVSTYTSFFWTVNCRSLINFLNLRLDSHAQWEIQEYAKAVYKFFKGVLPLTSEFFDKNLEDRGISHV